MGIALARRRWNSLQFRIEDALNSTRCNSDQNPQIGLSTVRALCQVEEFAATEIQIDNFRLPIMLFFELRINLRTRRLLACLVSRTHSLLACLVSRNPSKKSADGGYRNSRERWPPLSSEGGGQSNFVRRGAARLRPMGRFGAQ